MGVEDQHHNLKKNTGDWTGLESSYQRNYEDDQENYNEVAFLDQTVNLQTDEIIHTFLPIFQGFGFEKEQIWNRGNQRQKPSGDDKSDVRLH